MVHYYTLITNECKYAYMLLASGHITWATFYEYHSKPNIPHEHPYGNYQDSSLEFLASGHEYEPEEMISAIINAFKTIPPDRDWSATVLLHPHFKPIDNVSLDEFKDKYFDNIEKYCEDNFMMKNNANRRKFPVYLLIGLGHRYYYKFHALREIIDIRDPKFARKIEGEEIEIVENEIRTVIDLAQEEINSNFNQNNENNNDDENNKPKRNKCFIS